MNDLFKLISEFQELKKITGTSKTSSYGVSFYFSPWSDTVQVEFGGYDLDGYPRHYYWSTTKENIIEDFKKEIEKATKCAIPYDC